MMPIDLPAAAHKAGAANAPSLLIVDDDASSIRVLGRMLDGCGELRFACSGAEALQLARELPPDLVLLDAEMPGMSGFELCRALKADPALAGTAVIFVTSHHEPDYEIQALGLGAVDFITKPMMAETVLARVHARLRTHATALPGPAHAGRVPVQLLIADGNEDALHFARIALAPLVDDVSFARSGAEALAWLARQARHGQPPPLVLATLQLSDMDGYALCRRMRADQALCLAPLLLLGPRADWRSETQAFEVGASDFIARPFPAAVLQARVRNLLRQHCEREARMRTRRSTWQRLGEARVADLVAAAPEPWLAVDADGRVVLANAAAGRLLGMETAEVICRPLAELEACKGWPGAAARWEIGAGDSRTLALRLRCPGSLRATC